MPHRLTRALLACVALLAVACDRGAAPRDVPDPPDEPSPAFRNVARDVAYVGDSTCATCHASETDAWAQRSMAHSFHRWTPATRTESTHVAPIVHQRSGLRYAVVEDGGRLWQVETIDGPDGRRLHELRRRIDYVMGSGRIARTYFTEENGRLYQLPLTWWAGRGWDFSPGYETHTTRFSRELLDRCIGCHSSYPTPYAHLEGKYAELKPGIGCERCHGPGALHVAERRQAPMQATGAIDLSIVNPARLPLERRLDVCEQCHVHTAVSVAREGRGAFDYRPGEPLRDQWAYFRAAGGIDVVSHADRLRQSACFVATRSTPRPLECATCHDPHREAASEARNQPCLSCHETGALARRVSSRARPDHVPTADCVQCHMPAIKDRDVPHGTFTEHWIRVPGSRDPTRPPTLPGPVDPYYARDRSGPEAGVYQGMGAVVAATLANDRRALGTAANGLRAALAATAATASRPDSSDPSRPDASFLLGVAYQQLGDGARAIPALEASLRAQPERPEALRALAQSYAYAGRAPASIDSLYARALAAQPALAWIRAEYADVLLAQGERARAIAAYRAALAEQPSLATAWFNLGTALVASGEPAPASEAFRRAIALDPVLDRAVASLVRVRVQDDRVVEARFLPAPFALTGISTLGPQALRVVAAPPNGPPALIVHGARPDGVVQILRPDGTIVRSLPRPVGGTFTWDLRTDAGRLVGGGLYRARSIGQDASGRAVAGVTASFGVVRE